MKFLSTLKNVGKLRSILSIRASRSSSSFEHVNIEDTADGYSIITMNKKPVNSMSLESMQQLTTAIDTVEKTSTSRGVIIASTTKAFSAGLDLNELVNPDKERLTAFWSSFQDLHIRLYSSPLVTIAAVNGAAIAGGCALSLCCDYRIISEGKFKIGLNTVHTGLIAPYWVDKLYALAIGHRQAEMLLCLGHTSSPQEAFDRGIVDRVVSADDLITSASDEMKKWLAIPDVGRVRTKELMRSDFLEEYHRRRDEDAKVFMDIVLSDSFQNHIVKFVGNLKKK